MKLLFANSDHESTRLQGTKEGGGQVVGILQRKELKENEVIHWVVISRRRSGETGDFSPNWKRMERKRVLSMVPLSDESYLLLTIIYAGD